MGSFKDEGIYRGVLAGMKSTTESKQQHEVGVSAFDQIKANLTYLNSARVNHHRRQ